MNSIIVTPHSNIGPLYLGMEHEEIIVAIQKLSDELIFAKSEKFDMSKDPQDNNGVTNIRYIGNSFFFMVGYRDNRAVEISINHELRDHLPIILLGIDVFKTPAEEIVTALKRISSCTHDLEDEQLSTNYEFPDLGLRLWREEAFHTKLLNDEEYMNEMKLVIEEMFRYQYFELIAIQDVSVVSLVCQ